MTSAVLNDDLDVIGQRDEFLKGSRGHIRRVGVIDKGEMGIIDGHELGVGPCLGQGKISQRQAVMGKKAGIACFAGNGRVEPDNEIGRRRVAFELHPAQGTDGIIGHDPIDRAAASGFKPSLELRAGAPVCGEGVIGVDGERRRILRDGWR